ncbi:MAG: T9SS type A sorting domain-containing protein, partial [Ignavibacteriaceae bacterium]
VSDDCGHSLALMFGTAPDATDCFDTGYDAYAAPPPPLGTFNAYLASCADGFFTDIRATNIDGESVWDVIFQRTDGCNPVSFTWDPNQLPDDGNFRFIDFATGGSVVNVNMRTSSSYDDFAVEDGHYQIMFTYNSTFTSDFDAGFNMISLPLEVANNNYLVLYPTATSGTLFGFNGGYFLTEDIFPGEGYWLKFASAGSQEIEGLEIPMLELNLDEGWNMVGGPFCDLPLSEVIDDGSILIPNTLMGFDGAYFSTDTFMKGKGYWIRTNDAGTITLDCTSLLPPPPPGLAKEGESESTFADLSNFISLEVEDSKGHSQTLYCAGTLDNGLSIENYSLPPLPPAGLFDARISGGYRLSESDEIEINLQSNNYPLNIKMTGSYDKSVNGFMLKEYAGNVETGKREISDGMEITINNASVNVLKIQSVSLVPTRFVLEQNYPNPFNPGTVIKYELPFKANVKLQILNSIGQEIKTLVDKEQSAGSYEFQFDGSNLASGIYFYRIQAVDVSSKSPMNQAGQVFDVTKKMILLK